MKTINYTIYLLANDEIHVEAATKCNATLNREQFTQALQYLEIIAEQIESNKVKSENLKRVGQRLYNALFPEPLNGHFRENALYPTLQNPDIFCRIRLIFHKDVDAELISLPWEYLFYTDENIFLATHPQFSFFYEYQDWSINSIESYPEGHLSIENLRNKLNNYQPHVFHFLAHGQFQNEAEFSFVNSDGQAFWYNAESFSQLFQTWQPRLVILQACESAYSGQHQFTGGAAELVKQRIAAVIAMRHPVLQKHVWRFNRAFYKALANQQSIDKAVQAGRHVLAHPDDTQAHQSFEFATPVLWMRLQDGYLLSKAPSGEEVKPHTETPKTLVSIEIQAYLAGILTDTQDFEKRYIDLSAITTKTEIPAPKELGWSQDLIPSSFRTVDKHLNPESSTEKILDSISEALDLHNSFILLGDPGSGKTTTLKKLQLESAKQALQNPNARIPLYIRLSSDWPDHIYDIPSLLQHARQSQGLPPIHFNKLLILLDGLNEIAAQRYIERVKSLDEWLKANPKVSVVISCRKKHYLNSKKLSIPMVLVSPFDNERIQLFLNAYLGSEAGRALLPQLGALEIEKRSPRDLIHLAHNPYLLSLICFVYVRNNECLPESRGDLFRLFVKTLYTRELDLQATHGIDYQNLLEAFGNIAFAMQENRSSTSVHRAWAEKQVNQLLDINALWQLGREASLLEFAKDEQILHFTHQLILEYFAAEGLLKRYSRFIKYIGKPVFSRNQRNSGRWDEVVFTLAGITEPNELLMKLADCDPFLSVDCFEHIPKNLELTEKTLNVIVNRLINYFESGNSEARVAATEKVLLLKSVALSELIKFFETSRNPVAKRACLSVLAKIDDPLALKTVILALDDKFKCVRKDAEVLLEKVERDEITRLVEFGFVNKEYIYSQPDSYIVDKLLSLLEDKNEDVRVSTIKALSQLGDNLPVDSLLSLLDDKSESVRICTIKALSQLGDSLPVDNLLSLLEDKSVEVRSAAIRYSSNQGIGLPIDKLLLLLKDKNTEVRIKTIEVLSQKCDNLLVEKLLPYLNDNIHVVIATVLALAKISNDIELRKILIARLKKDDVPKVARVQELLQQLENELPT
ncbi:MAG: HEAT repeat domain-containing protein [Candidatus Methylumidiphilus sp.]